MRCLRTIVLILFVLIVTACSRASNGPAMSASISSDGKYILTSHRDKSIVLWNVHKETNRKISNKGNIYSAYFIKNSDSFIWQDLDKTVYVQNTAGKNLKSFQLPYHTYGHIMSSDLNTYISSDKNYSINISYGEKLRVIKAGSKGSFSGFGKLLNLSFNESSMQLLSTGFSWAYPDSVKLTLKNQKKIKYAGLYGPTLWGLNNNSPLMKLTGNAAKTYATFSPDGKNIISGCENVQMLLWDTAKRKLIWKGEWLDDGENGLPKFPRDYIDSGHHHSIVSTKFITNKYILRFNTYEPFAILYDIKSPKHLKFLALGKSPFPSVSSYSRNTAIDTAPEAGILVTGQRDGNGINVYKFDKEKLELEKVWVTH